MYEHVFEDLKYTQLYERVKKPASFFYDRIIFKFILKYVFSK